VGSVIVMFATGVGQVDAPVIDGQLSADPFPKPVLPASVQIGGVEAPVEYCGAAPFEIAGFTQVNVRVPAGVPRGDAVPVVLKLGSAASQANLTVAVR
jgi:uncharacterized protein (TIGR03437 family)